ncbi:hypothetical protein OKA04_18240 [Luteolibacter flavescens]|uniref:DUF3987 domain-containing protein n=1 Tax=Luteolibacter flavescens TaxID=1859460 RepID=A0ABT3FTX9_9BACT|nr:hypothetical protein [Luteolibacter flavescens]MCW1886684.1 hypothetical protein [Luteolibacter flavescens]
MNPSDLPDNLFSNPPPIPPDALRLLRSFNYGTLGDGNATAGMIALVSMCCTLAAVAGPGAAITSDMDGNFPVGTNFLTAGSLAVEQVGSQVLGPLRMLQNSLSGNAMDAAAKSNHYLTKKLNATVGPAKSPISPDHLATAKDSMLLDSLKPSDFDGDGFRGGAASLLRRKAFSGGAEVLYRPGFYFEGLNAELLSSQLVHCHMQHPLVHVPISDLTQLSRLEGTCLGIMDGCSLPIKTPMHIKGCVIARTSVEVLSRFVESRDNASWPYRTLWLVEEPLGPLASQVANQVRLDRMQERYASALESLLTNRLGEGPAPTVAGDIFLGQKRVVKHLVQLERDLPGVAGALRNLFPTLFFGMKHIVDSAQAPKGFSWYLDSIASLAIFLADRMVHSFKRMRHAEFLAHKQKLAASICQRLQRGPLTVTALCRSHNRLRADVCREVLEDLRAAGAVTLEGNLWQLADSPRLPYSRPPVIDVG